MAPAGRSTLNPRWPFFGGCATLLVGLTLGFLRLYATGMCIVISYQPARLIIKWLDYNDPHRCSAMFTAGRWLDWGFRNWQPDGASPINTVLEIWLTSFAYRMYASHVQGQGPFCLF